MADMDRREFVLLAVGSVFAVVLPGEAETAESEVPADEDFWIGGA